MPKAVFENRRVFAAGYDCVLMNDSECLQFLQLHFSPSVSQAFSSLKHGAHKADLVRYAFLYVWGGVYIDVKTELIKPLADIFNQSHIYTVLSTVENTIYQGIIAARPRQSIFLTLILHILETHRQAEHDYHVFTKQFYKQICEDVQCSTLIPGLQAGKRRSYFLFSETCSKESTDCWDGLDRYGSCCFVVTPSGEKVIKTRYASFPWK